MTGKLDKEGREIPDPRPMEIPAGFKEPESLESMIRRLVRQEDFRTAANNAEVDNWEDAEDFIIPEEGDFDMTTPYEEVFDPVLERGITPQEFAERADYYKQKYMEAENKAYQEMLKSDALRARPTRKGGGAGGGGSQRSAPPAEDTPAVDKSTMTRDK